MIIKSVQTLHVRASWRKYHFVRVEMANGIVGWSEYDDGWDTVGVKACIDSFARTIIDLDAMNHEGIHAKLCSGARQSLVGVMVRAIGAIENALLDAKAKHLGIPCYELLGGKTRDAIRVYWSHCGTWRISRPDTYKTAVRNLQDVRELGAEVRDSGFSALKTNIFRYEKEHGLVGYSPGFNRNQDPGRTPPRHVLDGLVEYLQAFRDGAGPEVDMLLDLNYNARTEGYLTILRALKDLDMFWIEIDTPNPQSLQMIRNHSPFTISGCESLTGLVDFLPYFQREALDVAIIDVVWIGAWQSLKIAATADAYQVTVAPHNYYGHLATMISGAFAACAPNLKIMETDIDRLPEDAEIFSVAPNFVDGHLHLADTPGWGTDPNEEMLTASLS